MAKYSTKFKYEIVKRYLDGEGSYESLSKTSLFLYAIDKFLISNISPPPKIY